MIERPTLLLDRAKAIRNMERMIAKANRSGVSLRPHFKTHQSAEIGTWFRERGIDRITVSSVDMAYYFADVGWQDITVAFSANPLQLQRINDLAKRVKLNLLLESAETANVFANGLDASVGVLLKIDAGYHRTGIAWSSVDQISDLARFVHNAEKLSLKGILTHAGNTYGARGKDEVMAVFEQTMARMLSVQSALRQDGLPAAVSVGDTPSCSLADVFAGADEIRPGNFIFYDLMQLQIGACSFEDIAVAVACPVVAKHPDRGQIVLYGGAIHLSKECLAMPNGQSSYGGIALPIEEGWGAVLENAQVVSLSQEHGIVAADQDFIRTIDVGDVLIVIPVHSCLTVNLFSRYMTLDGQPIDLAQLH
jgi:D-serine deaminase-like pyridoxal phosphate-dependent protein